MTTELEDISIEDSLPSGDESNYKLLTLQDREEWRYFLSLLPSNMQDVFYTPEYYELYEKNLYGKAKCFVFRQGNNIALYPFLFNRINNFGYHLTENYFDIKGAYGYNGIIYTSDDEIFRKAFHNCFYNFCKSRNIVAEFTRFNPLLGNHNFSKDYLEVFYNRQTIYVDLTQDYEVIYKNYNRCTRQNINQAQNSGLTTEYYIKEFPYRTAFIRIYRDTMNRVDADPYLIFNDNYFNNIFNHLPLIQFVVFKDKTPIASALCLYSNDILHLHFEGSYKEFLHLRPNDMLFDEVIKFGIAKGFSKLHLGGGRSQNCDDGLLKFKSHFSKNRSDFYIGKKIYNYDIYANVICQWEQKYPRVTGKYRNRVLSYRYFC